MRSIRPAFDEPSAAGEPRLRAPEPGDRAGFELIDEGEHEDFGLRAVGQHMRRML